MKLDSVHPATLASVLITTFSLGKDGELVEAQTATGFIYREQDLYFLVTNWHVVTGRNPDDPSHILIKAHTSPVRLEFNLPLSSNKNHFLPGGVDLYEKSKPIWIEAADIGGAIDIVMIPIKFPPDAHVAAVQDFVGTAGSLHVGQDVITIGYPFGMFEQNPHAIWKRAMVSSEPSLLLSGRPRFLVDVQGRPGMSGSPVYAVTKGMKLKNRAAKIIQDPSLSALNKILQLEPDDFLPGDGLVLDLVGIYSGALSQGQIRDLGLGFCWHAALLKQIIKDCKPGKNPFPPDFSA